MVDLTYDLIFNHGPTPWFIIGFANAMIHVFIMFCVNHKFDDKVEILPVMIVFCVTLLCGPILIAFELIILAVLACILSMRSLAIACKVLLGLNKE